MEKTKVKSPAPAPPAPAVERAPAPAEDRPGPVANGRVPAAALPQPGELPSAGQASPLMAMIEQGPGAPGKARQVATLQRTVGNARVGRMLGTNLPVPPAEGEPAAGVSSPEPAGPRTPASPPDQTPAEVGQDGEPAVPVPEGSPTPAPSPARPGEGFCSATSTAPVQPKPKAAAAAPSARKAPRPFPPARAARPVAPPPLPPSAAAPEPLVEIPTPLLGPPGGSETPASGRQAADVSAEGAMLLARLRRGAEQRKANWSAAAERTKAEVAAQGWAQQEAARAQIVDTLTALRGEVAQARAVIRAEALEEKNRVSATVDAAFAGLLGTTAEQVKGITALGDTYQQKTSAAVTSRQEAARKFGMDEGKRGKDALDKQAQEALAKGQAKAATYPKDERGQVQAEAVLKVAAEVAVKLAEPGPDLQSQMEDAGEELADGLDGANEQTLEDLGKQTATITAELSGQAQALEPQFTAIRTDVHRGIDDFVDQTDQEFGRVEDAAAAELQILEAEVVGQIDAAVAWVQGAVDQETTAAGNSVDALVGATTAAVEGARRPDLGRARSAVESAEAALDTADGQFTAGLAGANAAVGEQFAQGGEAVSSGVATAAAGVSGGLAQATAAARGGLKTLGSKAKEGTDKIGGEWDKSLAEARTATESKYAELLAGLEKELDKTLGYGKGKITAGVEEAVAKNREPLALLDAKMEEAAEEAREKYDAPWYKKLGRWLLHALLGFLKALGMFLLVVVVAVLAIAAIVIGFISGSVALLVAGIAVLLAVAGYVLYGIISGIVSRIRSADTWWQGIWGFVVGILDIVGLPGVIEGLIQHDIVNGRKLSVEEAGERFGSGLFALLTLLVPFLKAKGAKGPGGIKPPELKPPELKPPELGPLEVKPPEVAPPEVKPPEVAPPEIKPPEVAPPEVKPPEVKPPEVKPPEPGPPEIKPPEPKPPEPPPPEPKPPEPKPPEPKPPEPKPPETPAEIDKAKIAEAEAAETARRATVKNKADLAKLKERQPVKEKPPEGTEPGDSLWNDYVDYWNERVQALEKELTDRPEVEPKTKPPLEWDAYRNFRGKFLRGQKFQKETTAALKTERPGMDIQQDVGVAKAGETTKFVDQLGVDKAKLEAWEKAGKPKEGVPDVESFSNKSREFTKMTEAERAAQVEADVAEALTKYGGEVEVRRPTHSLFGQKVKVSKVTLIYDTKLVPKELQPAIRLTAKAKALAEGKTIEVEFK